MALPFAAYQWEELGLWRELRLPPSASPGRKVPMTGRSTLPREQILRIAARHGAASIRVFGSRSRGEERVDSDLDLLVEFEPGRSLLDSIAMEQELADLLGYPVQVLTPNGLSEVLRGQILAAAVPL